jgi:predicted nucleic acid-binding protein
MYTIRKKYLLTDDDISMLVDLLEHDALVVEGKAVVEGTIPADPQDELFLACALEGGADCIVSGDHHLLDLVVFREIPIYTPRPFLERLNLQNVS